jgi:hypothetical protein
MQAGTLLKPGAANPRLAKGGKTVYGARVGILMLETGFPRIPGDFGNLTTWPFPIIVRVVKGLTSHTATTENREQLIARCMEGATELVAQGADGISTSCGFLALVQDELAARCGVPVAASSLLQVPMVEALLPPGKRCGVITVSTRLLTKAHLVAAGASADTPLAGCENGTEFVDAFVTRHSTLDCVKAEADILRAGDELMARHPDVGAVVLECTNMIPFAPALQAYLRLPVYSAYTLLCWFQAGLAPRDFGHPSSTTLGFAER